MNSFSIKLVAFICMVVDHIGSVFFPEVVALRIIGRISFPLFCWLIAEGAYYTKNIELYLRRLFLLALVSQIPYTMLFPPEPAQSVGLNVLFTLSLGLSVIVVLKTKLSLTIKASVSAALLGASYFLPLDYGMTGVLTIVGFYLFRGQLLFTIMAMVVLVFVTYLGPLAIGVIDQQPFDSKMLMYLIQPFSLISLVFIVAYNGKQGASWKYFFYGFYPGHLMLLYVLRRLLIG